ncbi:MAG: type IV toxin-antitoxin system AbiEi family antitoxin, partial [Bifidobacteriaceae bacterium]|nr:type IV toxin-antitoxin system AbiEi family antitoxin [Bifidobacteriaceae bacterium]
MTISAAPERPRSPQAADWALAHGISSMTTAGLAEMLGAPPAQVPQRMAAPKRRGEWATPGRGLWIPVPPEFRAWGGLPATEFVDALMAHLGARYYVGWLAAAALHGAAHRAPQVTRVATSTLVRGRRTGRARLTFHQRSRIDQLPTEVKTGRMGRFRVSTPEVTALDVASDLALAGGLNNAATVISDLAREHGLDGSTLAGLAPLFADAAVRRVGWIVEQFGGQRLDSLAGRVGE